MVDRESLFRLVLDSMTGDGPQGGFMFSIRDYVAKNTGDRVRLAQLGRGLALVRWSVSIPRDLDRRQTVFALYQTNNRVGDPIGDMGVVLDYARLKRLHDALGELIANGEVADTIPNDVYEHCKRKMQMFRADESNKQGLGW